MSPSKRADSSPHLLCTGRCAPDPISEKLRHPSPGRTLRSLGRRFTWLPLVFTRNSPAFKPAASLILDLLLVPLYFP